MEDSQQFQNLKKFPPAIALCSHGSKLNLRNSLLVDASWCTFEFTVNAQHSEHCSTSTPAFEMASGYNGDVGDTVISLLQLIPTNLQKPEETLLKRIWELSATMRNQHPTLCVLII